MIVKYIQENDIGCDNNMNIVYEKATLDDAYSIRYIGAYSWRETYTGLVPDDYLEYKIDHFEDKVEREKELIKNSNYYVARVDNKTVGFVVFGKSEDTKYSEYGYLGALYLLKDYQGYGIGKKLFEIAVKGLKELGYSKMMLECMEGNNTINFYKKYSGEVIDTIDFSLNSGNLTVKADVMIFDINNTLRCLNSEKVLIK